MEPPGGASQSGYSHSNSMVHPKAVGASWNKTAAPARNNGDSKMKKSHMLQAAPVPSNTPLNKDERMSGKEMVNNQLTLQLTSPTLSLLV